MADRRPNPTIIIAICLLIAVLEGYDVQAFGVAAPRIAAQLHLGPSQMGWAGSVAMVGMMIGAVLGGSMADRWGRKPILALSVAAFGVFSLATAASWSFETLVLARFLTGLGFGGAMPNLMAIATDISPPGKRAGTTTSMFCGLPAGGALVALLARSGGSEMDWHTLFLVGGILPLLITPIVLLWLPETRPQSAQVVTYGDALWGGGRVTITVLLWLAFCLTLLINFLMLNWLPSLVETKGLSPTDGATASLWFNIASVLGALALGRLVDRFGPYWLVSLAFVTLGLAMWGLASAATLMGVLAFATAAGFLVAGGLFVLYAVTPGFYPLPVRAVGSGAAVAVGRFGSILGPIAAGQLRAAGFGPDQVFQAMIPVALCAAGTAYLLFRSARSTTSEELLSI